MLSDISTFLLGSTNPALGIPLHHTVNIMMDNRTAEIGENQPFTIQALTSVGTTQSASRLDESAEEPGIKLILDRSNIPTPIIRNDSSIQRVENETDVTGTPGTIGLCIDLCAQNLTNQNK